MSDDRSEDQSARAIRKRQDYRKARKYVRESIRKTKRQLKESGSKANATATRTKLQQSESKAKAKLHHKLKLE